MWGIRAGRLCPCSIECFRKHFCLQLHRRLLFLTCRQFDHVGLGGCIDPCTVQNVDNYVRIITLGLICFKEPWLFASCISNVRHSLRRFNLAFCCGSIISTYRLPANILVENEPRLIISYIAAYHANTREPPRVWRITSTAMAPS